MVNRAKYIAFSGGEGVGKTTQIRLLKQYLEDNNYSVMIAKELGTEYNQASMVLRDLALNKKWGNSTDGPARELIAQAARAINYHQVVKPNLHNYDFILQDRSMLCSMAYGTACGNNAQDIVNCFDMIYTDKHYGSIYDHLFLMQRDVDTGLKTAASIKQEFEQGDAMESKGLDFHNKVNSAYKAFLSLFANTKIITTDNTPPEETLKEIVTSIIY